MSFLGGALSLCVFEMMYRQLIDQNALKVRLNHANRVAVTVSWASVFSLYCNSDNPRTGGKQFKPDSKLRLRQSQSVRFV